VLALLDEIVRLRAIVGQAAALADDLLGMVVDKSGFYDGAQALILRCERSASGAIEVISPTTGTVYAISIDGGHATVTWSTHTIVLDVVDTVEFGCATTAKGTAQLGDVMHVEARRMFDLDDEWLASVIGRLR
jgi:hypothetical protein